MTPLERAYAVTSLLRKPSFHVVQKPLDYHFRGTDIGVASPSDGSIKYLKSTNWDMNLSILSHGKHMPEQTSGLRKMVVIIRDLALLLIVCFYNK